MKFGYQPTEEGVMSVHPLPSVDDLQKFYSESYYQAPQSSSYQVSYPEWELTHKRHKADMLVKVLLDCAGRSAREGIDRWIDIGCGEGFVLQAAEKTGMVAHGCDFSDFGIQKFHPNLLSLFESGNAVEILRRLHKNKQEFDFCSSINVLEHVIDPDDFLVAIRGVCSPEGLIAITVPNDFSRIQKRLQELAFIDREFWFSPPAHLHYFNTENLPLFLSRRGFEVVDMYSDFPVDLFLFHPGSNYIADPKVGPDAHRARVEADLLLAKSGDKPYLDLCRAMAKCGLGRDITVIVKKTP